jgi:hypothetical protein
MYLDFRVGTWEYLAGLIWPSAVWRAFADIMEILKFFGQYFFPEPRTHASYSRS